MKIAVLALCISLLGVGPSFAQPKQPVIRPAVDGVLAAFDDHPIVGLGDAHLMAQEEDFYAALVRDPRFAAKVKNVVVEFGAASDQKIVDRYMNGENVPYTELRKIWTDPFGWSPPPFVLGYANLFAQLRVVNLALPPAQRVRVWLSHPPVDWSKLKRREDFHPVPGVRDSYPASLIEREILARGEKALIIYGYGHFNTDTSLSPLFGPQPSLAMILNRDHPGALFVIVPYTGFLDKACNLAFEITAKEWPVPAIVTPIAGTSLDDEKARQQCPRGPHEPVPPGVTKEQLPQLIANFERYMAGVNADAMLYLGAVASLTRSPFLPDAYLDAAYQQEVMRHMAIVAPPGATAAIMGFSPERNTAAPRPFSK